MEKCCPLAGEGLQSVSSRIMLAEFERMESPGRHWLPGMGWACSTFIAWTKGGSAFRKVDLR